MRAAIYARKSTEQMGVSDDQKSVARQVASAREYAQKHGWQVAESCIFVDDAIGGAEFERRHGFVRLMASLKPKPPFDVVIMMDESRLGREQIETQYALKQLIVSGVRVWFYMSDRERTLDNPLEKAMLALQCMADEMEREKARQRTHDAMVRKARAGHVTGGRVFGYENVEVRDPLGRRSYVRHVIKDEEAAVIRRIFQMYAAGAGYPTIAKTLNGEGALSPRAQRGRPRGWSPSSVREVLRRSRYRGEIVYNATRKRTSWGTIKPADRPQSEWIRYLDPEVQIVSTQLWNTVKRRLLTAQARYSKAHPKGGRLPGGEAKYLLTGLLRCGKCGAGIEARTRSHGSRRVVFYGCSAHARKGRAVCDWGVALPASVLETAVVTMVTRQVVDARVLRAAADRAVQRLAVPSTESGSTDAELADIDRELANLTAAIAAGGEIQTLVGAVQERERRKAAVRARLDRGRTPRVGPENLRLQISDLTKEWKRLLAARPPKQRAALSALIKGRLVVRSSGGEIEISGEGTVEPVLSTGLPQNLASPTGNHAMWCRRLATIAGGDVSVTRHAAGGTAVAAHLGRSSPLTERSRGGF